MMRAPCSMLSISSMSSPPICGALLFTTLVVSRKSVNVTSSLKRSSELRGESFSTYVRSVVPSTSSCPLMLNLSRAPFMRPLKLTKALP